MGKGKGNRSAWVCPVRKGQIILEIGKGVDISVVRQAFKLIACQLGIPMKLVTKRPTVIGH
jgi:ribosomal protein L16/L10AE